MIGAQLKELRKKANLTQIEFAEKFNISKGTIAMWETDKRQPDHETLLKIADFFGVSTDYILGRTPIEKNVEAFSYEDSDIIRIPILGRIPAGIPMEAIEDILDYEEAPAYWARGGKEFFGLKLKGDSMSPEYRDNDVVIFKAQPTCESGDDCAVMVNGNDATFKRVFRNEKGIVLQPLNPAYEPMTYTNKEIDELPVRILGIVWELRRRKK